MTADAEEEKSVWNLLVRDFPWTPPSDGTVKIHNPRRRAVQGKIKFQLFEVMFATLLSRLRPNYEWYVTPNRADDGTDFVGRTRFLHSDILGISACITVGGQCKKSEGKDSFDRVSGSLVKMRAAENPTFFLVALASNLKKDRLTAAQSALQTALNRDCHILQRREIEALLAAHLDAVCPLLEAALARDEAARAVEYLRRRSLLDPELYDLSVRGPERVLAGQPFELAVDVRGVIETSGGVRLRWRPGRQGQAMPGSDAVTLIGPLGADHAHGAPLVPSTTRDDDPLASQLHLQLVSYAVGQRALGTLELVAGDPAAPVVLATQRLGEVRVADNVRPRFYPDPVRPVTRALDDAWEAARSGAVEAVSVVGSGGAGKSRVVEEFSLDVRRRGECVVAAKQANTLDYPRRLFANLLVALTSPEHTSDLGEAVLARIASYDAALAEAAAGTVKGLIGSTGKSGGETDDDRLVAVLLMLVRKVSRQRTLLLHLQDLHWCTADVLELLERILWQMEHLHGEVRGGDSGHGVMVVLEGRIGEEFATSEGTWSTRTFQAMVERLGKPVLHCAPLTPRQSEDFTRRLFEDRNSANPLTPPALLELQALVAGRIHRAASGNPFHILEQLKLLRHRGAVVQNRETGLHYVVRPDAVDDALPPTVSEAIVARWRYLRGEKPALAHLVWAAALLSERIPEPLFQRLWSALAPGYTRDEIEATEFLGVTGGADSAVALRHENYFQTLRRIELPPGERRRTLDVYAAWFGEIGEPTAQQRFDLARIQLAGEAPDFARVAEVLRQARRQAEAAGDLRLQRRVLGTLLDDVCWPRADLFQADVPAFLAVCDDEVQLSHAMVALGERDAALQRLERLEREVEAWTGRVAGQGISPDGALHRQRLAMRMASASILMNNRQPGRAAEISRSAVAEFETRRNAGLSVESAPWRELEMELYYVHSVALALDGDVDGALVAGERAVALSVEAAQERGIGVVSTYANILLARNPDHSERLLREASARAGAFPEGTVNRTDLGLNLGMCLIVLSHRDRGSDPARSEARLAEVQALLRPLFARCVEMGMLADAAAAALLTGLVYSQRHDRADIGWFADAVSAAARSRQMETLWRAHLNLASSMHREGYELHKVGEHARAAYEILLDTLSPYAQPERSHRFSLVRVPLAQAVRFLIVAGDAEGERALAAFPALLGCFADPPACRQLRDDRGGHESHEWLRSGEYDYVIY